jgi:hypothetical protein
MVLLFEAPDEMVPMKSMMKRLDRIYIQMIVDVHAEGKNHMALKQAQFS